MSYNDRRYRERDRSSSHDDRYLQSNNYISSDPRRSNWSSSSSSYDRRSEIPCRFGMNCRNTVCPYRHDGYLPEQHDRRKTISCRHGMNCTRPLCPYLHESEASSYSSSTNIDRTNTSSIGRRFEPPHTQSHLFKKRFEPPSNLQPSSSISHDASGGEMHRKLLPFKPPNNSNEKLDDEQNALVQQQFVPNRTEGTNTDSSSTPQQQQQITPRAKPVADDANDNNVKTDNEKCDTISEAKPLKIDLPSQSGTEEQNETNDSTDTSKVESQQKPTEQRQEQQQQQKFPQRTIVSSIAPQNGNTIQKIIPVQKAINPLRSKPTDSTTRKPPEPKPNRAVSQSTSTLANLLSSQRRSAAQLQRYRVQQARPFENIHHDSPSISRMPSSFPNNEIQNRIHASTKDQDDATNVKKKDLSKAMYKDDERVANSEKKETIDGTKEPSKSKLVAKENKVQKKRKADEMKSDTADSDTTVAAAKPRKKNKSVNPFRIKVGSVVSVRHRNLSEGGNPDVVQVAADGQSSEGNLKLFESWSEPIAGRHDGVSLLGRRIKCVFGKAFVEKWLKKNTSFAADSVKTNIEGNVVSILGSNDDQLDPGGIVIGLLVDREKVESMPFLQVMSELSKPELKKIEDKIRGEKNVVVKVTLASVMDKRKGVKLNRNVVKQWLVRNRVSAKPCGKKPTKSVRKANSIKKQSLFVGDGNDKTQQQEKNWRWVASRSISASCTNEGNSIDVASQLVGEVTAMIVHEDPVACGSLATVTIRRMWTPEQTKSGRTVMHDPIELFDDHDGELYFQAPVEDLVVVGKSVSRILDSGLLPRKNIEERNFRITHSYNAGDGTYKPLLEGVCDCRLCNPRTIEVTKGSIPSPPLHNIDNQYIGDGSISSLVSSIIESGSPTNFELPNNLGLVAMRPSFVPNTGSMKSGLYSEANSGEEGKKSQPRRKGTKRKRKRKVTGAHDDGMHLEDEEDIVKFKPTCSRTMPIDDIMSDYWYLRNKKTTSVGTRRDPSTREIARPRSIESKTKKEVTTLLTGRAARANQRRMVKSLGTASIGVDRIAGRDREHYLRFGKSTIEGWGVFTEEPINSGDLIIEYRGELIGHAVADKREREYEDANVPDYMFRIDAYTVCDATRLGNVARFINASCSPNCYTQIITANENKRIVIYAKRNIARGEELCYDYKFPIEMDPAKRIPCGCGSIECRGYMNWDKRWD
ncbi:hypothetical protein ACHAWT_008242 [Skeletonema menzelii]